MLQFIVVGYFDIYCIIKCNKLALLQIVTGCYYIVQPVLKNVSDCYDKINKILQSVIVVTKWELTPAVEAKGSFKMHGFISFATILVIHLFQMVK